LRSPSTETVSRGQSDDALCEHAVEATLLSHRDKLRAVQASRVSLVLALCIQADCVAGLRSKDSSRAIADRSGLADISKCFAVPVVERLILVRTFGALWRLYPQPTRPSIENERVRFPQAPEKQLCEDLDVVVVDEVFFD
jgi:hypothetical protein